MPDVLIEKIMDSLTLPSNKNRFSLFSVVEWSGVRMIMCHILYGLLDDRSIRYVDLRYRKDVGDFERERDYSFTYSYISTNTILHIFTLMLCIKQTNKHTLTQTGTYTIRIHHSERRVVHDSISQIL